jgi:DNA-binding Lrp family transcriptional regulator
MARFESVGSVRLDVKDKRLLYELDFDARQSVSQLAKKLELSKQGVEYKLARLTSEGVIRGFNAVVNMPKLGYLYCRLTLSLENANEAKRREVEGYLVNDPRFYWVFSLQGSRDFGAAMWAKSAGDFQRAVEDVVERFGDFISERDETITTDVVHYQQRYLLGIEDTKELHIRETSDRASIDDADKKILEALWENARMSVVDIAQRVGESPRVVSYRIKRLEKSGVIEAYRANIDHTKLGFTWHKLWIHARRKPKELLEFIKRSPIVVYRVEGVGLPRELDVEVMVSKAQELYDFVNELRSRFADTIGAYETFMIINVLKNKYSLP